MNSLRTVLIVDEDPYILGLLSALLPRFEFHVLSAEGPIQALEIAEQPATDLDLGPSTFESSASSSRDGRRVCR